MASQPERQYDVSFAGTADPAATDTPWSEAEAPSTAELLSQLGEDRLWLLRQLDSGRWSRWRLDLAALERELGQLIDQAGERL
ncbi:hypothetical protein [Synechococcus sp. BA-132 BA5]|uniref:hypothetical protein n=1 Tax=Synechococcus sp. BA-132 BA5 TaxID=3110252 RepID=UPI002B210421|nr:hypothetical protein [Synechococcus sp. BA-132 BA5]MEA5417508.1 hypothetical protein [Synechococcus sp. BA-132 BA5]